MDIQESKAVVVTNISPSANEKTVSDFFSFCGKITKLFLKKEEGVETSTAVVQFETESAAKTALLLTNALIIDRPITVSPYSPTSQTTDSTAQASLGTEVDQSKITQREFNVPDDERSKTSVVASLLAAGYSLGTDAFQSARDFDDKHLISLQAKVAVEQVKVKAHELDKQLGISEKAQAIEKAVNEKVKQLDESWKISEKANLAASTLKNTVEAVSKTAASKFEQVTASNPTLAKGMETIKTTADSVKNSVANTYQEVVTETNKAIEEKQKEKAQNAPVTTTTTTTTTTDTTAATDANIEPAVTDSVTDLQQPTAPGPQ